MPNELAPIDQIRVFLEKKITLITHKEIRRYEIWKHLKQSKTNSTGNAEANNGPASLDNDRVGQATAKIPHQVADAVERVVGERKGQGSLEENLGGEREGTHGSNHGGRLKVPTESGGGKVGSSPEVERAGESDTADTVQGTADPADLGLVDGEMRSNRAGKTLLDEDLFGLLSVGRRGNLSIEHNPLVSTDSGP